MGDDEYVQRAGLGWILWWMMNTLAGFG